MIKNYWQRLYVNAQIIGKVCRMKAVCPDQKIIYQAPYGGSLPRSGRFVGDVQALSKDIMTINLLKRRSLCAYLSCE